MDRFEEAAFVVERLNQFYQDKITPYEFIETVYSYFDKIKYLEQSDADLKFLKYISNVSGIPHYYDLLLDKYSQNEGISDFDLTTFSSLFYESTLHIDGNIKIHKYQKVILDSFIEDNENRFFLSATTSFGKTYLIYELIRKLNYKSVALIFPTIALLVENYGKLLSDENFSYFREEYGIHTLSDIREPKEKNIYIYTPERYLSFIDKHPDAELDFVFVDEIYKIDNEYLMDAQNKENERDQAYRVAMQSILQKSRDIFLAGPYIEFPVIGDTSSNQSFNIFLDVNRFEIINFNKYDIVGKSITLIKNGINLIDEKLTIDLKGYSSKKKPERVSKIIADIRAIKQNVIVYTSGPGRAESQARGLVNAEVNVELNESLVNFINHLVGFFEHEEWIIIKALKNKIGIHHGLVPKYIQKEIVDFFNKGNLDVLISTTTITEGVNTTAKNLLVLSSRKGNKLLKAFDAKNIAGRAGRFLHHFSGRVLIFDNNFAEVISSKDEAIKHKNFDSGSVKDDIDYFITEDDYLNSNDLIERQNILDLQVQRSIPDEIMEMYKVVSRKDKIAVYDNISQLNDAEFARIEELIDSINRTMSLQYDGLQIILLIVRGIIEDRELIYLVDNMKVIASGPNEGKKYSMLINKLYAYLRSGYKGSVNFYLSIDKDIDEAIRKTSKFVFSTLKYQLVKYLGVFNLMYKYHKSQKLGVSIDDESVTGIDKLLLKLEYNATTEKGRIASDFGVPERIVNYYESNESEAIRSEFDAFEIEKFRQIESIIND